MADQIPDHSPGYGSTCSSDDYGVNVETAFGPRINRSGKKRGFPGYRKTEALQPDDRSDRS
jgi:hypothetical protein